jgi:hypothetical protein
MVVLHIVGVALLDDRMIMKVPKLRFTQKNKISDWIFRYLYVRALPAHRKAHTLLTNQAEAIHRARFAISPKSGARTGYWFGATPPPHAASSPPLKTQNFPRKPQARRGRNTPPIRNFKTKTEDAVASHSPMTPTSTSHRTEMFLRFLRALPLQQFAKFFRAREIFKPVFPPGRIPAPKGSSPHPKSPILSSSVSPPAVHGDRRERHCERQRP